MPEKVEALAARGGDLAFVISAESTTFLDHKLESPDRGQQLWIVGTTRDLRILWTQRFRARGFLSGVNLDWSTDPLVATGVVRGEIAIGSREIGTSSLRSAVFIAELSRDGRVLWGGGAQPGSDHKPPAVARDAAGSIYLAGSLDREATLGPHTVTPARNAPRPDRPFCGSIYVTKLVRAR